MTTRKPHVFSGLLKLGMQRTRAQAAGFYLAHTILYLVLTGILMGLLNLAGVMGATFEEQVTFSVKLAPLLGLVHALVIVFMMLRAKNMHHTRKLILIGAGAVALGCLGGPLLSLLPISWLSTKAPEPAPAQG